jgi:hypothetical protein
MISKHRLTAKAFALSLGMVLILLLPVAALIALFLFIPEKPSGIFIGILNIIMFIATTCSLILLLGAFFHYLKITQEGIEYHRWPLKRVKVAWMDVEKISAGNIYGFRYATLLAHRISPGFEFKQSNITLGSREYRFIPLSDFKGWKEGIILEELKRYKPQLIVISSLKQNQPVQST